MRKYWTLGELTDPIIKQKQKRYKRLIYNISKHFTEGTKAKKDIVVFSYAKSVLQALDRGKFDNVTIRELTKTIDCLITDHAIKITLQWIPGHVNITE